MYMGALEATLWLSINWIKMNKLNKLIKPHKSHKLHKLYQHTMYEVGGYKMHQYWWKFNGLLNQLKNSMAEKNWNKKKKIERRKKAKRKKSKTKCWEVENRKISRKKNKNRNKAQRWLNNSGKTALIIGNIGSNYKRKPSIIRHT